MSTLADTSAIRVMQPAVIAPPLITPASSAPAPASTPAPASAEVPAAVAVAAQIPALSSVEVSEVAPAPRGVQVAVVVLIAPAPATPPAPELPVLGGRCQLCLCPYRVGHK